PKEITRTAKERRNGSMGFAEVIVMYYNKKSKYGLPISRLYRKNPASFDPADEADGQEGTRSDQMLEMGVQDLLDTDEPDDAFEDYDESLDSEDEDDEEDDADLDDEV
ncbi:MAG: hypothetical protein K5981_07660, partial [Clostridia bacterium]|nr:hypothetical protein [Clostridia bacterium]